MWHLRLFSKIQLHVTVKIHQVSAHKSPIVHGFECSCIFRQLTTKIVHTGRGWSTILGGAGNIRGRSWWLLWRPLHRSHLTRCGGWWVSTDWILLVGSLVLGPTILEPHLYNPHVQTSFLSYLYNSINITTKPLNNGHLGPANNFTVKIVFPWSCRDHRQVVTLKGGQGGSFTEKLNALHLLFRASFKRDMYHCTVYIFSTVKPLPGILLTANFLFTRGG